MSQQGSPHQVSGVNVSLLRLEDPSPLSPQSLVGTEKSNHLNEDKSESGIFPYTKATPGALTL